MIAFAQRRGWLLALVGLWLLVAALLIFINRAAIATMSPPDADDYLRLQQVRDWIAGQGWFDVSQHRINPPEGGAMHWSRIVDAPLALIILALRPLIGQANAELIAAVSMPLLLMGAILLLAYSIAARMLGKGWALVAAGGLPLSMVIYPQIMPLRVDHHGTQIVAALAALWALLDEARPWRSGVLAGLACAFWLNMSLEAAPVTAAIGALLGVRWLLNGRDWPRLAAFLTSLAACSLVLETITFGNALVSTDCDRLTQPYLLAIIVAAGGAAAGGWGRLRTDWRWRAGLAAAVIIAVVGVFALSGPQCLAGPFVALDPLTRTLWLDKVAESIPLWRRDLGAGVAQLGFTLVGCFGAALALRASADDMTRKQWLTLLTLTALASLIMVFVPRTGGVAHAFACIGAAYAARALFVRSRAEKNLLPRVFGTAIALLAATPVPWISAYALDVRPAEEVAAPPRMACDRDIARLGAYEPSVMFAPLDISPKIILRTPHAVIATGHHRNHRAIHDVIAAFTSSPDAAERIARTRGAQFLVLCATAPETRIYTKYAPDGLAARLAQGQTPDWLEPVDAGDGSLLVYRIVNGARL